MPAKGPITPAEVRKGPPGPDQLPQGEAQEVNEALEGVREQAAANAPEEEELPPVEFAPEEKVVDERGAESEEDKYLFAPTQRPQESITRGITPRGRGPLPADLWDWFPAMIEAAMDPTAPPQLKALVAIIADRIERS